MTKIIKPNQCSPSINYADKEKLLFSKHISYKLKIQDSIWENQTSYVLHIGLKKFITCTIAANIT